LESHLSAENKIVAAIRKIVRAVDLHSRQLVDEHGMTGPQLAVLREAGRLGATSVSALARAVHLSQPTVTGILDRLSRRGYIERVRDQSDRRSVKVVVTMAGQRFLNDAPSLLQDRFRRELVKLSDWERSMILATLQRIAAMMEAETLEASPVLVAGPMDDPWASNDPGASSDPAIESDVTGSAPLVRDKADKSNRTETEIDLKF